jgi:hypothetical protein
MPNNPRINPDSFYRNGQPIPASYFQKLDGAQAGGIDGDSGGTWAPSAPIQIGGAGLMLTSPASQINSGGRIVTHTGSGKRVVLGANDFLELAVGHELSQRFLETPIAAVARTAGPLRWSAFAHVGYQAFQYGALIGSAAPLPPLAVGKRLLVPLRVHHGATFQQAVLTYQVPTSRTVLPDNLPKMRIYAVDVNGVITPLALPPAANIAPGGWYLPDPATFTPASYSTGVNTIPYVPNTPGPAALVDRSKYAYVAEIVDESSSISGVIGTGNSKPGNIFLRVNCTFTNIQSLGFQ